MASEVQIISRLLKTKILQITSFEENSSTDTTYQFYAVVDAEYDKRNGVHSWLGRHDAMWSIDKAYAFVLEKPLQLPNGLFLLQCVTDDLIFSKGFVPITFASVLTTDEEFSVWNTNAKRLYEILNR